METYSVEFGFTSEIFVGKYSDIVLSHYAEKYGIETKRKLLANGIKIYEKVEKQQQNSSNHNILLVGKVQSGKTANLELMTGLFFDNGFQLAIVYGGYDTLLLEQTNQRFKSTFNYSKDNFNTPYIIASSEDEAIQDFDYSIVSELVKQGRPIIIIAMKRTVALQKIINLIDRIGINLKSIIIDDEGDQASLNTQFRNLQESPTYSKIVTMKKSLNNPPYFSVTATPQANIFLNNFSELQPYNVILIPPSNGYTGSEFFHLDETKIVVLTEREVSDFESIGFPTALQHALYHFILSSALMRSKGIMYSDMIIHTAKEVRKHSQIYSSLFNFTDHLKNSYRKTNNYDFDITEKLLKIYHDEKYFSKEISLEFPFENILDEISNVCENLHVILQNGIGKITQNNLGDRNHKIYIGGDLIQRGLTFDNLVTTFFTRWSKSGGNMDTTIQRCRWFGYRSKYLDLCKIFTTESIMFELSALATSESDLWQQLFDVEEGRTQISEIIIDSTDSSLQPTRKNVVEFKRIGFWSRWKNQKYGIFDKAIISNNNEILKKILSNHHWITSSVGRLDQKTSCTYAEISHSELSSLVNDTNGIFFHHEFADQILINAKGKKIILELLFDLNDNSEVRKRTFDTENRVSALQQGANTADTDKLLYRGDSYVLVDENALCIQVFKVLSFSHVNDPLSYTQFMYSIYYPQTNVGFIRG